MPVLFVGHGSPMNAIEDNEFSRGWSVVAGRLPRPRAILCVSAHWETRGTLVTAVDRPRTIHDFGGFPRELYEVRYPAPGSAWLAREAAACVRRAEVRMDREWGLDHGCWSVLRRMYPEADVPVVQLSLCTGVDASYHYDVARELAPLRERGVLVLGSGNIVHNLRLVELRGSGPNAFNEPWGFDWALEAQAIFRKLIDTRDHHSLVDYHSLGRSVELAVPTPEHYLPLLYVLALQREGEEPAYFNDKPLAGSLTMTSLAIGLHV